MWTIMAEPVVKMFVWVAPYAVAMPNALLVVILPIVSAKKVSSVIPNLVVARSNVRLTTIVPMTKLVMVTCAKLLVSLVSHVATMRYVPRKITSRFVIVNQVSRVTPRSPATLLISVKTPLVDLELVAAIHEAPINVLVPPVWWVIPTMRVAALLWNVRPTKTAHRMLNARKQMGCPNVMMYVLMFVVALMRNVFRRVIRLSVLVAMVMMAIPPTGLMVVDHCPPHVKSPAIVRSIRIVRTAYVNVSTNCD